MALENGNGTETVMPVVPAYGGYGNGGFGGYGDGSLFWIIILFLFAFNGGWGNGFGGGFGNGGNGVTYVANDVQRGFDQSAVMNGLNGINTAVANGFANAEVSRCNNTFALSNQISNLALNQATNACDNRASIADLKYVVAQENAADRTVAEANTRDILQNQNQGVQRILDQMCQDKIDAKNEKIASLEQQLFMSSLNSSQNLQTQQLMADNALQTATLQNALNPAPVPAYIVANPNCCGNYSYGCGCNG